MKVFVYLKTAEQKRIAKISAISEDRTKRFSADIGERPHRLLMLKAFEDFENFCMQKCGMKDKSNEVCIVNYVRMLSGDLFDFDTFMLGRDWCSASGVDENAEGTKQYLADLQG